MMAERKQHIPVPASKAAAAARTERPARVVLDGARDGEKPGRSSIAAARIAAVLAPAELGVALPLLLSGCMDAPTLACALLASLAATCLISSAALGPDGRKRPVPPALAGAAAASLAAILVLPPAREGFFALANGVIDRFDETYGAYAPLVWGTSTCAASPIFGACLGAAAGSLAWLVAGFGAPWLTLLAGCVACGFSLRLGLGSAACGCVLAVGAWIAHCRVSQLPGPTYSLRSLALNTAASAAACIALFAGVASLFTPADIIDDAQRAVSGIYREIRFGHDTLPEGDLAAAAAMNDDVDGSGLTLTYAGAAASDLYLRGFVGADFQQNAWSPLSHDAYEGDWKGLYDWLAQHGLSPSLQRSAFDDLAAEEGHGTATGTSAVQVDASRASRRYVYVPYTLRGLTGTGLRGGLEGSLAAGLLPGGSYAETIDDVSAANMLAATGWLASSSSGYTEAERVYAAFVEANYLQISDAESTAARELIFDGASWADAEDATAAGGDERAAGSGDYAAISRVRAMLTALAAYTESPADALTQDGSFLRWFLGEAKEGNSAYFATAAVLAFRSQGLPARYAEGYRAGAAGLAEASASGGEIDLGAANAHAWAEVYLDGLGWTPVEVTPGFYTQAVEADEVIDVGQAWSSGGELAGEAAGTQEGAFSEDEPAQETPRHGSAARLLAAVLSVAAGTIAGLALLAAAQRAWRVVRRKRLTESEDQSICVPALYTYLADVMAERGIGFDEDRPLDCAAAFEGAFEGIDSKEYRRAIELHQAYAFGGRDLRPNELRTLRRFDERLHKALPAPKNLRDLLRRRLVRAL